MQLNYVPRCIGPEASTWVVSRMLKLLLRRNVPDRIEDVEHVVVELAEVAVVSTAEPAGLDGRSTIEELGC